MRWDRLFDDLAAGLADEAKLEQDALAEDLQDEEWGSTPWTGLLGGTPTIDVVGAGPVSGRVAAIGRGWVHVLAPRDVLLHVDAVQGIRGGQRAGSPAPSRQSWASTWRALAGEDVRVVRRDGSAVEGVVGVAGADFVEVGAVVVPVAQVSAVWSRP